MKKTYIKPSVEVNRLALESMIANSVTGVSGINGLSMGEGDFAGGAADGKVRGSRSTNDFDDLW